MAVGLVDKLDTATLLRATTVMRDRRHISNHVDTNTQSGESTNRRFATRTWALDFNIQILDALFNSCLLYTSDAADDLLCVDLGGPRILKKKKKHN